MDQEYFENRYDEWDANYVVKGKQFAADCQRFWDEINDSVFAALRSFGYHFADEWLAYPVHPWPNILPFKDPLTFVIRDNLDDACNFLIHELVRCHEDYPANQSVYEPVRQHMFTRFPGEHIAVRYHIITNLVQWAVLRRVFPERWAYFVDMTKEHPLLARTATILEEHESKLDYNNPLGSLLTF